MSRCPDCDRPLKLETGQCLVCETLAALDSEIEDDIDAVVSDELGGEA